MVQKKDIDWGSLGFAYQHTDYSYVCNYKDGEWGEGELTPDHTVTLSECAGLLHYCQEVFEGLKAYTAEDGSIVCFRPDMNAQRMYDSAARLEMPSFPKDKFVEAVEQVVKANAAWVPPFGSGATLYIRPFMFATGDVIGVKPADEYQFRILVTPVGPYYKGGVKPVKLVVPEFDRAAPHGTGNIKAGLNYAMSLHPSVLAHAAGYADNLFLDPQTRTYVEETGGANVLFVTKEGKLVVPQSFTDSILPPPLARAGGRGPRYGGRAAPGALRRDRPVRRVRHVRHRRRHLPGRRDRQRRQEGRLRHGARRPRHEEAPRDAHGHPVRRDRG